MTLIFTHKADSYTTVAQRWSTPGSMSLSTSNGRLSGGKTTVNNATYNIVAAANEHATFILGAGINISGGAGTGIRFQFRSDSGATIHTYVDIINGTGILAYRGDGTLLGSIATAIPLNTWFYIEVKVLLNDSTGTVTVRKDAATVLSLTSKDTKNGGTKTVFDSFGFTHFNNVNDIDDVYACNGAGSSPNNDFLGDIHIEVKYPSGAGTTTQLTASTGANYTTVDENPPNTTDYNGSATNDQYDTYAMADLTTASGTVFGVNILEFVAKSDAGAKGGAIVVRSGGTDYEQTDEALATGYAYINKVLETDPATSAAWTISNVNAMEVGFKAKAS